MKIFLILSALIALSMGHGDEEETPNTIEYSSAEFVQEVPKTNHFVMFYAPWCGHCRRLSPTWEQLAEMLNNVEDSNILIAKVDCTVHNSICTKHDVTGYPTLKFFKKGESEGVRFRGTRDLPSLSSFINEQLGTTPTNEELSESYIPDAVKGLRELTEDTFDKHVASGKHFIKFYAPWCGHCQKLAPTWEELAETFENDVNVDVSKVDCTIHRSVCNQFDVKGYPTLLWIENGKKIAKYQGVRGLSELKTYVKEMSGAQQNAKEEEKEEKPEAVSPVLILTNDNFQHKIESGVSFVKFFAPWCGHCKRLAPTWEELARKFIQDSEISIAKVDCTLEESKALCSEQEVDGFPTLFLYKDGRKISEYTGNRAIDDLHSFVVKNIAHDEL